MTLVMGDSTTLGDIPKSVDIVCTYVDGHEGVVPLALLEELFPSSKYFHVFIDVNGSRPDVHVRDWETGDKAGSLEQWVIDHNKHTGKKDAVVYCNRSTIPEVRRLTKSQILGKDYFLWVATGDGTVVQGEGVIACQDKWAKQTGGHWDSSVVFDDNFWDIPKTPSPPKPPTSPKKPNCTEFQRAIRATVDNMWGPLTDEHAEAIIEATNKRFPHGVTFAQVVVGTRADGAWGPNSKRSLKDTTAHAQRALHDMGFNPGTIDGIWGPKTSVAYAAARKACHI
jgi:hypothetical protein